ncbi:hypothetical protein DL96DRAFT_1591442 [Flagelloscypha sp. PMI_526]|nr:hypothetical protein DL96DRAFT_1591442 [Flagelloscypha sp. PMI_526]
MSSLRIHTLYGCLVVATWVNSFLFRYSVFVDVVGLAGQFATVCLSPLPYGVVHYGDVEYLLSPEVAPRILYLAAIQCSGCIVQCYLISRIQRLSENWYISIVMWLAALLSFGGGLALTIINATFSSISDRSRQTTVTSIWLITAAALDVLIALTLVYYFQSARKKTIFSNTHNLLSKLIYTALETGSITAILAVIVLVLFRTLTGSNLPVAFVFMLGRAYSLTMIANLNARRNMRQKHSSNGTESQSGPSAGISLSNRAANMRGGGNINALNTINYPIEIQVSQNAISRMEDGENFSDDDKERGHKAHF